MKEKLPLSVTPAQFQEIVVQKLITNTAYAVANFKMLSELIAHLKEKDYEKVMKVNLEVVSQIEKNLAEDLYGLYGGLPPEILGALSPKD